MVQNLPDDLATNGTQDHVNVFSYDGDLTRSEIDPLPLEWEVFSALYVNGNFDATVTPAFPSKQCFVDAKAVHNAQNHILRNTSSSDSRVLSELAARMESHFITHNHLPVFLPADHVALFRAQWYSKQIKMHSNESMLQVQRMSSYMLDMPYVSIKLLGPEPLVKNVGLEPCPGQQCLFPFSVVTEWTSKPNCRSVKDETGCSQTLAAHSLLLPRGQLMVIPNVDEDWRFSRSPYRNGLKFFIATPLYGSQGEVIGSFCVGDIKPRPPPDEREKQLFMDLTSMITNSIDLSLSNAQLDRRDQLKRCVEFFLCHFLHDSEHLDDTDKNDVFPTISHGEGGTNSTLSDDYLHIFNFAAETLHASMDVSGVAIFDLSCFVLVKKPTSIHGKVSEHVIHSSMTRHYHSGWEQSPDEFSEEAPVTQVPALTLLGASEAHCRIPERNMPMNIEHVNTLCQLLTTTHLGQHFRQHVPEAIARLLPEDTVDTLIVPIMGVDRQPFALLCCYSRPGEYAFILDQMVHTAIQHVRAIGYMIMDAVAKQSVMLADRAKSSFISNMSHELRTPLHGILASTELLSDTNLNDMQLSYAHTIESCGHGLLELVNHVLDYTKLSSDVNNSGTQRDKQAQYHDVDLVQLLQEVCDSSLVGHLGQRRTGQAGSSIGSMYDPGQADAKRIAKSFSIELVIEIEKREGGWLTFCDSGGIRRVLTNLIGNALKFTEQGYILVSLQHTPISEHKIRASFRVKDTGCGISRSFLDQHLFQPFSQEDPLKGGTGLGLSIVNELVRNFENGAVHVESIPHQGTDIVVSCDLALSSSHNNEYIPRLQVAQLCTVHIFTQATDSKGTALLTNTLRQYLISWWGFQVVLHEVPADTRFLDILESGRHILLMNTDVSLLKTLRESMLENRNGLPPVVVLANLYHGRDHLTLCQEYKRAGGVIYMLQKPVGPARLEEVFAACVSSKGTSTDDREAARTHIPPVTMGPETFGVCTTEPFSPIDETPSPLSTDPPVFSTPERRTLGRLQNSISPSSMAGPISPVPETPTHTMLELDTSISGQESEPEQSSESPIVRPPNPAPSGCVLFADDNAINRQVLRAYSKKLNMSCSEARDGREAISQFSSRPPGYFSLILMDYSMPNVDGLGATLAIRQLEEQRLSTEELAEESRRPRTAIYMLSGTSTSEILRQSYAAGADGYLSKPLRFKVFVSLLKSLGLLQSPSH